MDESIGPRDRTWIEPHYPTAAELDALRRDFCLTGPDKPWHNLAKIRVGRGQAWNMDTGGRAADDEKRYGIGGSTIGDRQHFRDARIAVRSGECFQ